ncbi:protein ovarian tumor locus-like isoform X2 [Chrysoperla carnea]|uniref:protein ovarian tumor locus-like isoform X2 n=1 Tax=Chrysoperla carnea TaxID=189513 RepID=UPI001D073D93|nr:protein ovarian tumor locus-like isoform X2 [Chrysoperla carnea]
MSNRGFLRRSHRTVDQFLEKLGYYRKCIARDETCLFRIVAEQLYNTQTMHLRVREEVLQFMIEHRHILSGFIPEPYDDYLDRLRKHLVVCGDIEISIVSLLYGRDVLVFEPKDGKFINATARDLKEKFLLCRTTDDHYDGVFRLESIETAAFCQSMMYELLYERVFDVKDTDIIVDLMLHSDGENSVIETNNNSSGESGERLLAVKSILNSRGLQYDDNVSESLRNIVDEGLAPFSFKVAKALDPTIYRNIEFDSWNEMRKEIRYNQWYKGGEDLTEGVRCMVRLSMDNDDNEEDKFMCYIQKLSSDSKHGEYEGDKPCVVYIEELAKICTVRRDQLEPLPHATAWPLPLKTYKHLYKETLCNKKNIRKSKTPKSLKNCKILDFSTDPDAPKLKIKTKKEIIGTLNAYNNSVQENVEYITMPAYVPNPYTTHSPENWNENTSNDQIITSPHTITNTTLRNTYPVYATEYLPQPPPAAIESSTSNSYVIVDPNTIVDYPTNRPHEPVNYNVSRSQSPNGADLPYHDIPTLRFFFNFGLDYFRNINTTIWHHANGTEEVYNHSTPMITAESPQQVITTAPTTGVWPICSGSPVIVPHVGGIDTQQRLSIDMQHLNLKEECEDVDYIGYKNVSKNRQWNNSRKLQNQIQKSPSSKLTWQYNSSMIARNIEAYPTSTPAAYNCAVAKPTPESMSPPSIEYNTPGYYTHFIPEHPQNFVYAPAPPDMLQPYIYSNCYPAPSFAYVPEGIQPIPYSTPQTHSNQLIKTSTPNNLSA